MTDFVTQILIIDTETTGMDPLVAEVVQVGLRHGIDALCETSAWNIKPTRGMTAESTAVHGLTDEMAAGWPTFGEVASDVADAINKAEVLVGYNPDYDIKMLSEEFKRCGQKIVWPKTVICCKRLWDIYRPRPPRGLTEAYQQFVNPNGFKGAHGAVADMAATAQVLQSMMKAFDLGSTPWDKMDPERMTWWGPTNHVIWQQTDDVGHERLICNFGKHKGKPYEELEFGFIRWVSGQDFPPHVKKLGDFVISKRTRPTAQELTFWARVAL